MIEKFCEFLTKQIRKRMPEVDDERAEIINYGLQLVVGEIPKNFIIILLAFALGIGKLTLLSILAIAPYRSVSGGFHLKTHIGCVVATSIFYLGNVYASQYLIIEPSYLKYIILFTIWLFSMIMIKLYAPADTENVPIISKKDRKLKKILSYIIMTITLLISIFIKDIVISNLFMYGVIIQTLTITRVAYIITNNKYGHEEYEKQGAINLG